MSTRKADIGFDFLRVWIADSVTRNVDRKDNCELHAKKVDEGDSRIAFFHETYREFDRVNLMLAEERELRDDSGSYECIRVDSFQSGKKKHPWLTLRRIAA